ncbi:hypothetical protein PFISCL1PPCAC_21576, partial [Pristionchus fissidentatus]
QVFRIPYLRYDLVDSMPPKKRVSAVEAKGGTKKEDLIGGRVKRGRQSEVDEGAASQNDSETEELATSTKKTKRQKKESPLDIARREIEKLQKELAEAKEREADLNDKLKPNFDLSKVKMEKAEESWQTNYQLNRKEKMLDKACEQAGAALGRAEGAERKLAEVEKNLEETEEKLEYSEKRMEGYGKRLILTEKKLDESEKKLKENEQILEETKKRMNSFASASSDLEWRNGELKSEVQRLKGELTLMRQMPAREAPPDVPEMQRKMREENSILKEQLKMAEEQINDFADTKAQYRVLKEDHEKLKSLTGGKGQIEANDRLLMETTEKLKRSESSLAGTREDNDYLRKRNEALKDELWKCREDNKSSTNIELKLRRERERGDKLEEELRSRPDRSGLDILKKKWTKEVTDDMLKVTMDLTNMRKEMILMKADREKAVELKKKAEEERDSCKLRIDFLEKKNSNQFWSIPPPPVPPVLHPADPAVPAVAKPTTVSARSHLTPMRGSVATVPCVDLSESPDTVDDDDEIMCLGETPKSTPASSRSKKRHS